MTAIDTVRAFYAALGRGDVPGVLGLLADEIAWTETPRFPYYSGTWTRPQQVLENLLVPASKDWDGFSVRTDRFIVDGDTVVALGAYGGTSRATGRALDAPLAHVWQVAAGKIVRFDQYTDTVLVREAMT